MIDLSLAYMNKLANQIILISALLGGFSLAVLVTLLSNESSSRIFNRIFRMATISTTFFLIAIFAMTNILMKTTEGFPFEVEPGSLGMSRILGTLSFFLGILGLTGIITLSGWTKSRRMGWFTTIIGLLALLLMFLLLS